MRFIKHRSIRIMMLLAIAAIPALVASALPASAATARSAAAPKPCTVPVFFGLHGMGEGPSLNISAISPELGSFDAAQNAISGAVLTAPVSYTTVYPNWLTVIPSTYGALLNGENNLQADITSYSKGCSVSQDKIALVGYSMGAWVINKWIVDHPLEWPMIKAVVLYGDPCWVDGKDQGLAREYAFSHGCMPATSYPFPVRVGSQVPFPTESWSAYKDPISGADWAGQKSAQLKAAENCTNAATCSHLTYAGSSAIKEGAQFVVSNLVG